MRNELELAFQLYWVDYGACAGRLRTSLERLMDHYRVPKTYLDKNRKRKLSSLNNRIDAFEKKKPGNKDLLHALRVIGNLGTQHNANRAPLLDGFKIYEHALATLFEQPVKEAQRIARKIKRTRGVYVKKRVARKRK